MIQMMVTTLGQAMEALGRSPLHDFMVKSTVAFPACETLHFMGLCLLIGSLFLVDVRALGLLKGLPFGPLHKLVPVALLGFAINLATGICFIAFDPGAYATNIAFLWKMALIPVAGVNALIFEFAVFRPYAAGRVEAATGPVAKVTALLSLLIWTGVLLGGRLIPFV
jgi:hypothetical protein